MTRGAKRCAVQFDARRQFGGDLDAASRLGAVIGERDHTGGCAADGQAWLRRRDVQFE